MGLIRAAAGSVGGTFADQWKEFFYCDALDQNTLAVKGQKRTSRRSSNTKGNINIISSGSGIAVADGQCMMIVEQGKIVEFCAEPGAFTFDASTEPSIFTGSFGDGLQKTFHTIGKRFTFGGDTGKDQRIYYFNTKEIVDNKFGTPSPVPLRIVDKNIGLDIDISVRCNGIYSYKLSNPMLFYTNVCGNVEKAYTKDRLDAQLKTEFLSALQPALAKISALGVRYSAIPAHTQELSEAMNEELDKKWGELRGLEVVSVGINALNASEEDELLIKKYQRNAVNRDPSMAAANLAAAQADAMENAANNSAGAFTGFMGMGMATQAGGTNAADLFRAADRNNAAAAPAQGGGAVQDGGASAAAAGAGSWTCACGSVNDGNFCPKCGKPRPAAPAAVRFCPGCGFRFADPAHPPKFCPNCGKPVGSD